MRPPAARLRAARLLALVQGGLEQLYRIRSGLDVTDFVVGEETRRSLGGPGSPREQLLIQHDADGLWLGLFVDPRALETLAVWDPRQRLDDRNFHDLCLVVEGVSHFLLVVWRAAQGHPVSPRERELQGEVDKYATCALTLLEQQVGAPDELWPSLFARFSLDGSLSPQEQERYLTANREAGRYASELHRRFITRGRLGALMEELRRFYRLGWREKLERIAALR